MAPVSEKGVFVGYEPTTKGYRILRDRDGIIIVTRNVVFDEKPRKRSGGNEFEIGEGPEEAETLPEQERPEERPEKLEPVGATDGGRGKGTSAPGSVSSNRTEKETSDKGRTERPQPGVQGNNSADTGASANPQTSSSENRRVTGRQRRKPGEWYKTSAHFAGGLGDETETENEDPRALVPGNPEEGRQIRT